MKNIRICLKIFIFLVVKLSVYLNRHGFVMSHCGSNLYMFKTNTNYWCGYEVTFHITLTVYCITLKLLCPGHFSFFPGDLHLNPTPENIPSDMCTQRRLKSACASAQSDQSLCSPLEETLHPWQAKMHREDSDQTARMRRLIWIFSGNTYPKLRFLTLRLLCVI